MKPFTSKHCAQYLSKTSPLEQSDPTKKMTQSVEPVKNKKEETRYKASPPENTGMRETSRKLTENTGKKEISRKMTNLELVHRDQAKLNDSLQKLPKGDKHHLPTFDTSTDKGMQDKIDFYTFSPKNQKLRDIRKLGAKIRKKHGF